MSLPKNFTSDANLLESVVSSKLVYDGSFLKVQKDQVKLSNAATSSREYILHPGAAMIIPLLDEKTVILERQYRHPLKQVFWEFPAGKIDIGETAEQTAHRELREETGYQAGQMNWLTTLHPGIGYSNERIEIYLARDLVAGSSNLDENEFVTLHKVPVSALLELIRTGQVTDVKTQIGIFWLEKILSKTWEVG
jgi:ADP-ribose pyrophosphatase